MPSFCEQAISSLKDPNADFTRVAEVVKYDPGMTANILRIANSAYFGMPNSVTSLKEAFVRIGTKKLLQIIVANGIASRLNRPMPGYELQPDELLSHSIWVAVASEEFCLELQLPIPDTLFTAGLLHDMGKVVLDDFVKRDIEKIMDASKKQEQTFDIAERTVLGLNHADVGAMIIEHWGLPKELVDAAKWHHEPQNAKNSAKIVSIVHLANALACAAGVGTGRAAPVYQPGSYALEHLNMTHRRLETVASRAFEKMLALKNSLSKGA